MRKILVLASVLITLTRCVGETPATVPSTSAVSPVPVSPVQTASGKDTLISWNASRCIEDKDYPGDNPGELITAAGFQVFVPAWVPKSQYSAVGEGIDEYWRRVGECRGADFVKVASPAIKLLVIVIPTQLGRQPVSKGVVRRMPVAHGWYRPLAQLDRPLLGYHCIHARWLGEPDSTGELVAKQVNFLPVLMHEMEHWYWFLKSDPSFGDEQRVRSHNCNAIFAREPRPAITLP